MNGLLVNLLVAVKENLLRIESAEQGITAKSGGTEPVKGDDESMAAS
jgi:hypothetical protein